MDALIQKAQEIISSYDGKPLTIMEVCGTHTHEIFRLGLRSLLPKTMTLISGPGCPVCVTPTSFIDEAIYLACEQKAIITTFGDLVRVPGTEKSLAQARSEGADVRVVYSPLDAVSLASENPKQEVVFLSVGFETTVPGECLAVLSAKEEKLPNFSLLCANKTMPKAYHAMAGSCDCFLYPGHVHAITGTAICEELCGEGVSGVIAGFTAHELITAMACIAQKAMTGEPFFANCYPRVVKRQGNREAQALMAQVMEEETTEWRGLGSIPKSGLRLREMYASYDARKRFAIPHLASKNPPGCRCGDVLQGKIRPKDCPLFGQKCTPVHPIGACMVSNEGTCSAYYQYGAQ